MSWVAVAVVGGAVVGGVGSNMQARAANRSRTAHQESTTSQNPYMHENINPGLENVINMQESLVARGAPQIDRYGNVTYAPMAGWGGGRSGAEAPPNVNPGAGGSEGPGGVGAGNTGGAPGGRRRAQAPAVTPAQARRRAERQGGGSSSAPPTTGNAGRPASAEDIFRQAADRGFAAGDTETQTQARNAMGNILGEAGGGGPEQTGFEGYNPILDRLAGTLENDVNNRTGRNLLLDFLNENNRGGNAAGGNQSPTTPRPGGGRGGTGSVIQYAPSGTRAANAAAAANTSRNNTVPDTMVPESYFGTETRRIMDEEANQKELEDVINTMNQDVERGMFRDLAQLDAAAQGSGRFGGSMFAGMSRDAREESLQEMTKNASQVRMGDRESRRQARLAALSGVNARDLGLLNANVQREGIAAGERSASAAASAGAGAAAEQAALARRGQDLSALGALMDYEQGGVGQLSNIGSQLSSDRLNTLGLVPGLEGIGINGLNVALGGGQGLADIRANAANAANARAGINLQRQGQAQQLGMFNAGQSQGLVNEYLNSLRGIGGLGGTNITRGISTQPGAGQSVGGSTLMGMLSGASTGAGLAGMSDERLKENINVIDNIGGIDIAEWDWTAGNLYGLYGHDMGVIAQDVMHVLPDAVTTDASGYMVVDYSKVAAHMKAAL